MVNMKNSPIFKNKVLRYPRLDTVLMVEETIRKTKGDLKLREIWKILPKQAMWQTFMTTIDYLEYSGKIHITKDKHVVWIWAPAKIEDLITAGNTIIVNFFYGFSEYATGCPCVRAGESGVADEYG